MKKIYLVTSFVVLLLVSFLGITYSYEYNGDSLLRFELLGDYEIYLNKGETYVEYGVKVYNNGEDISDLIYIDSSMLDVNRTGNYKIKYEVTIDGVKEYVYRIVHVVDDSESVIKLLGDEIMHIKLGEEYIEPGYELDDIEYDIIITSDLDVNSIGEYKINYIVIDTEGNKKSVIRKIIVN